MPLLLLLGEEEMRLLQVVAHALPASDTFRQYPSWLQKLQCWLRLHETALWKSLQRVGHDSPAPRHSSWARQKMQLKLPEIWQFWGRALHAVDALLSTHVPAVDRAHASNARHTAGLRDAHVAVASQPADGAAVFSVQ